MATSEKMMTGVSARAYQFKLRPLTMLLCIYSHLISSSVRLQTHDKLLHTRHPKRDIFSARPREHVDVDSKRQLAIVVCYRCTTFQHPTHQTSVEK